MTISTQTTKMMLLLLSVSAMSLPVRIEAADGNQQIAELLAEAEGGSAGAQYLLGYMYAEGQRIPKDFEAAVKWYTEAANQGHAGAQLMLGMIYAEGKVVPQDNNKAIQWYTKAAEQGNAGVQLTLATLVADEQAGDMNYVEACKWALLAEMNGKDVSIEKAWLTKHLSAEQIAESQALAKAFAAEFPNSVSAPKNIADEAIYVSKSDGFHVWFPSPPNRTVLEGGKRLLPVHYQSFADNGTQYNVSLQYRKSGDKRRSESDKKLLEDYLIGRAIYAKNQTIRKKFSKFKGYNAAQFIHNTRAGGVESVHEGIVFIVDGDFVSLTCVYPSSLSPSPTFNEYADSFEFLLAESKEPTQ